MLRTMLLTTAALAAVAFRPMPAPTLPAEDITHLLSPGPAPAVSYDRGEGTRRKSLPAGDMALITRTLVGEAARQGDAEAAAIAHVVLNRLESGLWGDSVAAVVLHQHQRPSGQWTYAFTAFDPAHNAGRNVWGPGLERTRAWARLHGVVEAVWQDRASGHDPTQGSLHYFHAKSMKPAGAIPRWAKGKAWVQIGEATFVKGVGR